MTGMNRPRTLQMIEERTTVVSAAADAIREAIYAGSLEQGDRIPQVSSGKSLGISRGTLREALRELQEQGLLEIIPHRGAFVTSLSPSDIVEIYTFRALLESSAARKALEEGVDGPSIALLNSLVEQMDVSERFGDLRTAVDADIRFHRFLCEKGRNSLVVQAFDSLSVRIRLCMLNGLLHSEGALPEAEDHEGIVAAMANADPVSAEEAVREHCLRALKTCLRRYHYVKRES